MSMDGKFLETLIGQVAQPKRDGELMLLPPGWKSDRDAIDIPDPLRVISLAAIRDYISEEIDELPAGFAIIVDSPRCARVVAPLGERYVRREFLIAEAVMPGEHPSAATLVRMGNLRENAGVSARPGTPPVEWLDQETFVTRLQSEFVPTPARDELLALAASVQNSNVRTDVDDTVSQTVTVTKGAAIMKQAAVKNPWTLRPRWTFPEVEQPEVPFVFRVRPSRDVEEPPTFALIPCDGGLWKIAATAAVVRWLRNELPEASVIG